jgi:CBS domain-containing protein
MAKTVREAMTAEPVVVQRWTAAQFAAQLMEREDVGSLPVVEENGDLVGIVTDRDIALRVGAAARDPEKTQVGEILTEHPTVVFPDDPLIDALELMASHQPVLESFANSNQGSPVVDVKAKRLISAHRLGLI